VGKKERGERRNSSISTAIQESEREIKKKGTPKKGGLFSEARGVGGWGDEREKKKKRGRGRLFVVRKKKKRRGGTAGVIAIKSAGTGKKKEKQKWHCPSSLTWGGGKSLEGKTSPSL